MKSLLTISALFEAITGIGLVFMSSVVVPLLLGVSFIEPAFTIVTTILGSAMISIALVCWLYRKMGANAIGIVKVMLFYNMAAGLALGYGGIGLHLTGYGLWPAVAAHVGLALWCMAVLGKK